MPRDDDRRTQTAVPSRNFSLATEDRVRALVAGPPAFMRRLRAIEDLEETIVRTLAARLAKFATEKLAEEAARAQVQPLFERLNELVARHNRFYPIEADLPLDPRTGDVVDRRGGPFRRMSERSLDELVARARSRLVRPAD